jgi:hypothetical protein
MTQLFSENLEGSSVFRGIQKQEIITLYCSATSGSSKAMSARVVSEDNRPIQKMMKTFFVIFHKKNVILTFQNFTHLL